MNNDYAVIASSHLIQAKVLGMILNKLGYHVEILAAGGGEPPSFVQPSAKILFADAAMEPRWFSAFKSGGFTGSFIALYDRGGLTHAQGFDGSLLFPVSASETKRLLARLCASKGQDQVFMGNVTAAEKTEPGKNTSFQIFSKADLEENFMGNMDLVRSLLGRFIERTEQQVADIPGIAAGGDWETARRDAHTIKGSARSMSGMDLGDAAMRWEDACKNQDLNTVHALAPEVAEALLRFKTAAQPFLSEKPATE
jgi:HPt (histidine-containing phosphotransfer) domain-containing protein